MIVCKWPSCEHQSTDHEPLPEFAGWGACLLCDCPGYHSTQPRRQPDIQSPSAFGRRKKAMRRESKRRAGDRTVRQPQRDLCHALRCCVDGCSTGTETEPHHYPVSRGRGGGDRGNVVPLCAVHHAEFHQIGQVTFQRDYEINLTAVALALIPHAYPDREATS